MIEIKKLTGAKRGYRDYLITIDEITVCIDYCEFNDEKILFYNKKTKKQELNFKTKIEACELENQKVKITVKAEDEQNLIKELNLYELKFYKEYRNEDIPESITEGIGKQGTKQWFKERAGKLTASNLPLNKNGLFESEDTFMSTVYEKVAELLRIDRNIEEKRIKTEAMTLGNELEHFAIEKYIEENKQENVKECNFTYEKERNIGVSLDGFTNNETILEVKTVSLKAYVAELMTGKISKSYKKQAQAQMYIYNKDKVKFLIQCVEDTTLKNIENIIERDERFIFNMRKEALRLSKEVKKVKKDIDLMINDKEEEKQNEF